MTARFRMYFGNEAAGPEQLQRVEDITVTQEMGRAWEARIRMTLVLDEQGAWTGENEDIMAAFSQVRIEMKAHDGAFQPLIDGPIVGYDNQKSSLPGQSAIVLIVHDDSVYMNQEDQVWRQDDLLDHELVESVFNEFSDHVKVLDVEETPASGSALPPSINRRESAWSLLQFLASRQDKHAYVLPGQTPGESVGVFKELPEETDGLPDLVLIGSGRNIDEFNVNRNAQSASRVTASTMHLGDKALVNAEAEPADFEGGDVETDRDHPQPTRFLPATQGEGADLQQAVRAAVRAGSFTYEATGSIRGHCYHGVLQPYRLVTVRSGGSSLSGSYLIHQVTHSVDASQYTQSFQLKRMGQTPSGGAAPGSIF